MHFLQHYYKYYNFVTSNDWYHIMCAVFCQLFYLLSCHDPRFFCIKKSLIQDFFVLYEGVFTQLIISI